MASVELPSSHEMLIDEPRVKSNNIREVALQFLLVAELVQALLPRIHRRSSAHHHGSLQLNSTRIRHEQTPVYIPQLPCSSRNSNLQIIQSPNSAQSHGITQLTMTFTAPKPKNMNVYPLFKIPVSNNWLVDELSSSSPNPHATPCDQQMWAATKL